MAVLAWGCARGTAPSETEPTASDGEGLAETTGSRGQPWDVPEGAAIGIQEYHARQSLLVPDAGDSPCDAIVFDHVGDQNKPIAPMVVHTCVSTVMVARRAVDIVGDPLLLPRLVQTDAEYFIEFRLLVEDRTSLELRKEYVPVQGSIGPMGMFDVVITDGEQFEVGRLTRELSCELFSALQSHYPNHELSSTAQYYRTVLACHATEDPPPPRPQPRRGEDGPGGRRPPGLP